MGAGSSSGGKRGELLETMADHEESINCMVLREDLKRYYFIRGQCSLRRKGGGLLVRSEKNLIFSADQKSCERIWK